MTSRAAGGWFRIIQEAGIVVLLTTLGKAIAFFKIQQIASQWGSTLLADGLLLVMGFVLLWDAILITGAVSVVLVSDFVRTREHEGSAEAYATIGRAASGLALLSLAVGALLWLSAPYLIKVLAPGFTQEGWELGAQLIRWFAFLPLIIVALNIPSIIHQIEGRPVVYGSNLVLLNLIQLVYLLYVSFQPIDPLAALHGFVWVFIGSHLASTAVQWAFIPSGARRLVVRAFATPTVRALTIGASPLLAGIAFQELNVYINFAFASTVYEGAVAIVAFSDRLVRLALAVVVAPLLVVVYPRWAAALSSDRRESAKDMVGSHLVWMFLLLAPLAVYFILGSAPLVALVYGSSAAIGPGAWEDLNRATVIFGFGMLSSAFGLALLRLLVLERRTMAVVWATGAAFLLNIGLNLLLVPLYGVPGIAAATVVALTVQTAWFYAVLWRGDLLPSPFTARGIWQTIVILAGSAGGVYAASLLSLPLLVMIPLIAAAGYAGAVLAGWIAGIPEVRALPRYAARVLRRDSEISETRPEFTIARPPEEP